MNEEEILEMVDKFVDDERLVNKKGDYYKPYKFGQAQRFVYKEQYEAIQGLLDLYNQEKEKNKKLEEQRNELAMILSDKEDERVELNKVINNLAQAIKFMSTNEKLTVEDIIKEFSKENKVTEEFMQRWEKSQHKESQLKDKVIDMMAEKLRDLKDDIDDLYEGEIDCFIPKDFCDINGCAKYKDCAFCIKEYYFKVAKGEEYKNKYCGGED